MFVPPRILTAVLVAVACQVGGAAQATGPEIDPDRVFKGSLAGNAAGDLTEVLPAGGRIAVPLFRMGFVVDSRISAEVRAGTLPGRTTGGAQASLRVVLLGVDADTMQRITDHAYATVLAQLQAAGRETVPRHLLERYYASFTAVSSPPGQPYVRTYQGRTAMFFAPTGMPLVMTQQDAGWEDAQAAAPANYRQLVEMSADLGATVLAPLALVDFARMRSTGTQTGRLTEVADTRAELLMSVLALSSAYIRAAKVRDGVVTEGDEGSFRMSVAVPSPLQFGSLHVTSRQVNGAYDLPGSGRPNAVLAGPGTRTATRAAAQTNNADYLAAATDAVERASALLGNWFRKYSPGLAPQGVMQLRLTRSLAGQR